MSKFRDVFPDNLRDGLPPSREVDHLIGVVSRSKLVSKLAYRLSHFEVQGRNGSWSSMLGKGLYDPTPHHGHCPFFW